MSEFNTMHFFKFLNNNTNWFELADSNQDDVVIKKEFETFMKKNSSEFEALTGVLPGEDLINSFWAKIDSSRENKYLANTKIKDLNAITKNSEEYKNIQLLDYGLLNILEKFYQDVVLKDAPAFTNPKHRQYWCDSIKTNLQEFALNLCNKNIEVTEDDIMGKYQEIKFNDISGLYMAQLQQTVLKTLAEYDIETDTVVTRLVENYMNSVDRSISPNSFLKSIEKILNAYLGQADINGYSTNPQLLAEFGYTQNNDDSLNTLQQCCLTERLQKTLLEQLCTNNKTSVLYNSKPELFNKAIKIYISEIASDTTFDEYKTKTIDLNDFINSDIYKDIEKLYEIEKMLEPIIDSEFYNKLQQRLGFDTREAELKMPVAINILTGIEEYDEAKAHVESNYKEYIKNDGQIDHNKVLSYILDAVCDKILLNMPYEVSKDQDASSIRTKYADATDDASHIRNEDLLIQRNKNIAITTCNAIAAKSDSRYQNIFNNVLGTSDYNSYINNLTTAKEIQDVISKLLATCLGVEAVINTEKGIAENAAIIKAFAGQFPYVLEYIKNSGAVFDQIMYHERDGEFDPSFGIVNGSIVFRTDNHDSNEARYIFNVIVNRVWGEFCSKPGFETITWDYNIIQKLVQTAWIMNYNHFDCSWEDTPVADFALGVFDRLKTIFWKLSEDPSLLSFFTSHTAYANFDLTNDLVHYNRKTTADNDEYWHYHSNCTITDEEQGTYNQTMSALFERIANHPNYERFNRNDLLNLFNHAKAMALNNCSGEYKDCPYGTGDDSLTYDHIKSEDRWAWGTRSRDGDGHEITTAQLVQLTLYYFDLALYGHVTDTHIKQGR